MGLRSMEWGPYGAQVYGVGSLWGSDLWGGVVSDPMGVGDPMAVNDPMAVDDPIAVGDPMGAADPMAVNDP